MQSLPNVARMKTIHHQDVMYGLFVAYLLHLRSISLKVLKNFLEKKIRRVSHYLVKMYVACDFSIETVGILHIS